MNGKRRTRRLPRFALVLALCAALPAATEESVPRHAQAGNPHSIRILAYNIRHGQGMDGKVDLRRAAQVIRTLQPDLVTLQEMDNGASRTDGVDQAQALGELTAMHATFGAFMDYQGGEYGMAILSKYPIVESINHRLPEGAEPRSALAARIRLGDADVIVLVGIHLYATAEQRYAQAHRLVEIFENETAPVFLAGDFNSRPGSAVMDLLAKHWIMPEKEGDRLTFSSTEPRREIDFILYRPAERFEVVKYQVIDEPLASDHRPVLLELKLR